MVKPPCIHDRGSERRARLEAFSSEELSALVVYGLVLYGGGQSQTT
jgi:hypothetical protein